MATKWTAEQMPSQAGKTVLVTGANSGIGFQTAKELARHGATVLVGVRDAAKGRAAVERIQKDVPGAKVEVALVDMASLASVRAFAQSFLASGRVLDVLVNNAGVMAMPKRELTADGFERQFGTNHLGHFALTGLLLPAMERAADPRVVTVASLAHRNGKIEFDNLQSEKKYVPWDSYNASKLANLLFALELDRRARAAGARLKSIPVHPGVSRTSIVDNGPGWKDPKSIALFVLGPLVTQDDAAGALPTEYAATSPDARSGDYIGPDGLMEFKGAPTVVQPRPHALDQAVAARLWEVSERLTGVAYPDLGRV